MKTKDKSISTLDDSWILDNWFKKFIFILGVIQAVGLGILILIFIIGFFSFLASLI